MLSELHRLWLEEKLEQGLCDAISILMYTNKIITNSIKGIAFIGISNEFSLI